MTIQIILKKYNFNRNRGDHTMMAVFEMIQEENTKIFMNGKKQGKIEGVKEIARKLLSKNLSKKRNFRNNRVKRWGNRKSKKIN